MKNKILSFIFIFIVCLLFSIDVNAGEEFALNKENLKLFQGQQFELEAIFDGETSDYVEKWLLTDEAGDEIYCSYIIHTHNYITITSQTNATCTTAGSISRRCSCGEIRTEMMPALGHSYNGKSCSRCGALNPNYIENTVDSTNTVSESASSGSILNSTDGITKADTYASDFYTYVESNGENIGISFSASQIKCKVCISQYYTPYGKNFKIIAITKNGNRKECNLYIPTFEEVFGIDTSFKYMNIGTTIDLKPKIELDGDKIAFTSSNESVVSIDENYILKILSVGEARISISETCYVWFNTHNFEDVNLNYSNVKLNKGEPLFISALIEGEGLVSYELGRWYTDTPEVIDFLSEDIAEQESNFSMNNITGNFIAKNNGRANIIFELKNGETRVCSVEVVTPSERIILNKKTLTLNIGDTYQLEATVYPDDSTYANISWTSSDEEIATVDKNGIANAVSTGIVCITATTEDGVEKDCIIMVLGKQVAITTIPYTAMMKFNNRTTISSIINVKNFPVLDLGYQVEVYSSVGILKEETNNIGSRDNIKVKDNNNELISEYVAIVKGDVTGNGEVKMYDAFQILKDILFETQELNEVDIEIRDYNCDGQVKLYDSFQFLKQSLFY